MPSNVKRSAEGVARSEWIRLNNRGGIVGSDFNTTVTAWPAANNGASVFSVEYTDSEPEDFKRVTITRSTTTATLTLENHGLAAGDCIVVRGALNGNNQETNFNGTYQVATVPSDDTLTYTVADTGAASARAEAVMLKVDVLDGGSALSAKTTLNVFSPVTMVRLNQTASDANELAFISALMQNQ